MRGHVGHAGRCRDGSAPRGVAELTSRAQRTTSAERDSTPVDCWAWLWNEKPGELVVHHFTLRPDRKV